MAANQQVILKSSLRGCQTTVCHQEEERAESLRKGETFLENQREGRGNYKQRSEK